MRLFLAVFGVVLGLGALEMVSGDPSEFSVQPQGEPSSGGFFGTVLGLPKKIVVGIFRAIGAVLRIIFVRVPEGLLDVLKRVVYRVATVFGKKDPYDLPASLVAGANYNQQTSYKSYIPTGYNNYGNSLYRNPYGRRK